MPQFGLGQPALQGPVLSPTPLLIDQQREPLLEAQLGDPRLLGLTSPSRVTGINFWPVVIGETRRARDYAVQTYGWICAVRTQEWNYSEIWKPEAYRQPYSPQLYNLEKDPKELTNVAETYPEVARQLSAKLKEYIASGEGVSRGSFNETPSLNSDEVYETGSLKASDEAEPWPARNCDWVGR